MIPTPWTMPVEAGLAHQGENLTGGLNRPRAGDWAEKPKACLGNRARPGLWTLMVQENREGVRVQRHTGSQTESAGKQCGYWNQLPAARQGLANWLENGFCFSWWVCWCGDHQKELPGMKSWGWLWATVPWGQLNFISQLSLSWSKPHLKSSNASSVGITVIIT